MPSSRLSLVSLAFALLFVVPLSVSAQPTACNYDFEFSLAGTSSVRIEVTATCPGPVEDTTLRSLDHFAYANQKGNYASIVVPRDPSPSTYCADAYSTYWTYPYLSIDVEDTECRTL